MKNKFKRIIAGFTDFYICCFWGVVIIYFITFGECKVTFLSAIIYIILTLSSLLLKDCFLKPSIGKRIFKLEVIKTNGTNLTNIDIIKRNVVLLFLLPIELLMLIVNGRRIGDIWSNTSVTEKKDTLK